MNSLHEYLANGVLDLDDLDLPTEEQLHKGVAITECIQLIPCNPCVDICPVKAITMKDINSPPIVDFDRCTGCTLCVGICPGLAIFVVKHNDDETAHITLPYEFTPVPKKGDLVTVLDRWGKPHGEAIVLNVRTKQKTAVITIQVPIDQAMHIRNIKVTP